MKKVFFAAFAGVCVLTSILATPAVHSSTNRPISQILRDTVPPKDTTKMLELNAVVLRDTVPPKDTTKLAALNAVVLMDTVPPKDTTKVNQLMAFAFNDTVPGRRSDTARRPSDTTSMPRIDIAMR